MHDDSPRGKKTIKPKLTIPAARTGLLTLTEASAMLNVSKITLRRWTKNGMLRCVRIGRRKDRRFRPADLEEFVATHVWELAVAKKEAAGGVESDEIGERISPFPES